MCSLLHFSHIMRNGPPIIYHVTTWFVIDTFFPLLFSAESSAFLCSSNSRRREKSHSQRNSLHISHQRRPFRSCVNKVRVIWPFHIFWMESSRLRKHEGRVWRRSQRTRSVFVALCFNQNVTYFQRCHLFRVWQNWSATFGPKYRTAKYMRAFDSMCVKCREYYYPAGDRQCRSLIRVECLAGNGITKNSKRQMSSAKCALISACISVIWNSFRERITSHASSKQI